MIEGNRYDLVLTVERRSSYDATIFNGSMTVTRYRYQMHDAEGNAYVYSGVWVRDLNPGKTYRLKATAKRYEEQFKCWRLRNLVMQGPALSDNDLLL